MRKNYDLKLSKPVDIHNNVFEFYSATEVRPGDIIMLDSEYIWVTSVNGNTVIASRGYGGDIYEHDGSSESRIVGNIMGKT